MKAHSSVEPAEFSYFLSMPKIEFVFTENVEFKETFYEYDEYRLELLYREGIIEEVEAEREKWLYEAKQLEYDKLAAQVRELRNRMLEESDKYAVIDKIISDVPTGTTFASWLPFLKTIGDFKTGPWGVYRQALRDIPAQQNFPYDVVFPTRPEI